MREGDPVRRRDARLPQHRFRRRLVPRHPGALRVGADVGNAAQIEDTAEGTVLTGGAVQRDDDRVRPDLREGRQQRGVGIPYRRVDADRAQRVEYPAAGAERHLALVRETAGEDQHMGFHDGDHSSPGAGA